MAKRKIVTVTATIIALGGWGGGGGREGKYKRNIFSGDGFTRENDFGGKEN